MSSSSPVWEVLPPSRPLVSSQILFICWAGLDEMKPENHSVFKNRIELNAESLRSANLVKSGYGSSLTGFAKVPSLTTLHLFEMTFYPALNIFHKQLDAFWRRKQQFESALYFWLFCLFLRLFWCYSVFHHVFKTCKHSFSFNEPCSSLSFNNDFWKRVFDIGKIAVVVSRKYTIPSCMISTNEREQRTEAFGPPLQVKAHLPALVRKTFFYGYFSKIKNFSGLKNFHLVNWNAVSLARCIPIDLIFLRAWKRNILVALSRRA